MKINKSHFLLMVAGILNVQNVFAAIPAGWKYGQEVQPQSEGPVQINVPWETVARTANAFNDFRILDFQGKETAFSLVQQMVLAPVWTPQDEIKTRVDKSSTLLSGRVTFSGDSKEIDALKFVTPKENFLKSVTVRGSQDGILWNMLADRSPIFRQSYQAENLEVTFKPGPWHFLKIDLDDTREASIPITQIFARSCQGEAEDLGRVNLSLGEVTQNDHETEIRLKFSDEQFRPKSLLLEVQDPVFHRHVEIWASFEEWNHQKRERMLGAGTIFRVSDGKGHKKEFLQVETSAVLVPSEIVLRIFNGDAPPLTIKNATAEVAPFKVLFYAKAGETYQFVIGNPAAPKRNYDLSGIQSQIKLSQKVKASVGPLVLNTRFKEPEVLADLEAEGTPVDVSQWEFRRKVELSMPGVQSLELDLDVLTRNGNRTQDLRLVRNGNQIPYIVSPETSAHELSVAGKNMVLLPGKESRWQISIPYKNIPSPILECDAENPIFQRSIRVVEQVQDERGDAYQSVLGNAQWVRLSGSPKQPLLIPFSRPPQTQTLYLEIDNGDNAPLKLSNFRLNYQTKKILFKASPGAELFLYYGNPAAAPPSYEIDLLRDDILKTKPVNASLEPTREVLKVEPWYSFKFQSKTMKYVFWVILGLVAMVLLGVIAKLLPEENGSGKT